MKNPLKSFALHLLVFATAAVTLSAARPRPAAASTGKPLVYVGTYTDGGAYSKSSSQGIYAYRLNETTGQLTSLGLAAKTSNPSFVVVSPNGDYLYAVDETDTYNGKPTGAISAFAIHRSTGKLTFLNEVESLGTAPCHLSIDKTGKFLMVANYDSGSVAVFPLGADGRIGKAADFIQHHGSSVNKARQAGPHAHFIATSPDNRFALNNDLGLDKVFVYRFNAKTGKLTPNQTPWFNGHPGAGPRHLAFSPNGRFVYLVSEMGSTLTVLSWEAKTGVLHELQNLPAAPKSFTREANYPAEVEVLNNDRYVYISNRGMNTIGVYAITPGKGTVKLVEEDSTQGKYPRQFTIDPTNRYLLAANQNSANLIVYRINHSTGHLTPTAQKLKLDFPVCIAIVPGR